MSACTDHGSSLRHCTRSVCSVRRTMGQPDSTSGAHNTRTPQGRPTGTYVNVVLSIVSFLPSSGMKETVSGKVLHSGSSLERSGCVCSTAFDGSSPYSFFFSLNMAEEAHTWPWPWPWPWLDVIQKDNCRLLLWILGDKAFLQPQFIRPHHSLSPVMTTFPSIDKNTNANGFNHGLPMSNYHHQNLPAS